VLGVFEGGGAKGALYVGALEAMAERNLWFSAVAGSSAGAITAALIASGMGPSEIRESMPEGLDAMSAPSAWKGLWRVRKGTGYLDRDRVWLWLRDRLRSRFPGGGPYDPKTDRGPTFEDMFDRNKGGSGVDLYVVALDLTGRHVMVFNHALTPRCPVADAVTASATIPVVFEPLIFQAKDEPTEGEPGDGRCPLTWRFVADGGLASNFPDFVFQDAGFRRYAGLPPLAEGERIVGFLLDEDQQDPAHLLKLYRKGEFLGSWSDLHSELARMAEEVTREAREVNGVPKPESPRPEAAPAEVPRSHPRRWLGAVVWGVERALWLPIGLLAWASQGTGWPWAWPPPKNRHARLWMEGLRQWFTAAPLQTIGGTVVFGAMFWVGFLTVTRGLMPDLSPNGIGDIESVAGWVFGLLVTLAWLVFAVWVWMLGTGAFLLMLVSYRTVGLIGHPLVRAFLYAPAAPPWAGLRPNETVIRLRVPKTITTLGVRRGTDLDQEIEKVRASAFDQLASVAGPANTTSPG
jgi:predicted acylesterase/phospholipase RssA